MARHTLLPGFHPPLIPCLQSMKRLLSITLSRPLFIYVKKAHVGVIPGINEYLAEYTSDRAMGEDGYLADKGLIPAPAEERAATAAEVKALKVLSADAL